MMRKVALCAMLVGCASSDPSRTAAPSATDDAGVNDAAKDARAEAGFDSGPDAVQDTRPPQFACGRTADCSVGACCAHVTAREVDATVCSTDPCASIFTDASGVVACGSDSDCPSSMTCCRSQKTNHGRCASAC